jgi:HD-GYP domain-containing protein (c-di-GMP phosphodiesterase class II)
VSTAAPDGSVRLAELVATMSYAADLGLGQPLAHCMRKTVIALRMADLLGVDPAERQATFYTGLLANVYCHADAAEQATWFGDDITFKQEAFAGLAMSTPQMVASILRRTAGSGGGLSRVRRVAGLTGMRKRVTDFLTTHATLASEFAGQIGLDPAVATSIRHTYEQWDGSGLPGQLRGEEISLPARLTHLAGPVEVFGRLGGVAAARAVARRHRASQYDPAVVDLFCDHAPDLFADLEEATDWDAFLATQSQLSTVVTGEALDRVLEAMADLVDLKSPFFAGHSRGVANLAAESARLAGWSPAEVVVVRRAGLVHDLGRLGVSNEVLDRPGTLSVAQRERVRLHPYLTDRMLAGVCELARCRQIAARHHERLDGSGYPHGLTASALTPADRLLAAADAYHAMTEPRPHRGPLDAGQAAAGLRDEVSAGRLDGDAAAAVLKAAGHRLTGRPAGPGGLTPRETEILAYLARGQSNREIAARLVLAPKTVGNHVEHIYAKLGIASRAAATLFATRHGLVGGYEPAPPA